MTTTNPGDSNATFSPVAASVAAYEQTKAEIEAIAKDGVVPMNADVPFAVRVMLTIAGNVTRFIPELEAMGLTEAKNLALRANALSYAQALHDWTLKSPARIDVLAEEVIGVRRLLNSELELMQLRGLIAKGAVSLQGTTSHLAMAQDVRAIASAFLANWEAIGPQIGNDLAHVHSALVAADELIAALAQAAEIQEKLKGTALLRAAAWTLAFKSYSEIDRGIHFIRYNDGDMDDLVPSLFDHGNRPRKKTTEKPAENGNGDKPGAGKTAPVPTPVVPAVSNGPAGAPVGPVLPSTPFQ